MINLHVHDTKGSLLDAIQTVEQIAEFAHKNNQFAVATTNHGVMHSYVDFVKACKKHNVKPIIGCEIYEVDDMFEKSDTKEYRQPRYHLILLCKTQQGYKNLLKIVSIANTEGFYKKSRVSIDWIKEKQLGKGIICLTACQAGRLSRLLVENKNKEADEFYTKLSKTFDYVVCEIQSHNTESQSYSNKKIYEFVNKNNLPYVITTDAHMTTKEQLNSHAIFVKISEDREVGESYIDCFMQTQENVYNILNNQFNKEIINKGIQETINIANIIEDIDIGLKKGIVMPKIKIQEGFKTNEDYLRYLIFKDFDKKFKHFSNEQKQIRKNRLEMELPILIQLNFTDYFIMLYMLAEEAKKRGIPRGYSRGSGANCLCLYMLGVTQIDSIRWDLDFSRFANLGRKSVADFDWDISKRRRKEFIDISEELFGKENVAPIATFNTLSTKVAIRDIGKVLDEDINSYYYKQIPYKLRDEIAKMIPTIKTINDLGEEIEKDVLLREVLFKNNKLKDIYEQFPLWFKYVMELEGLPKSIGRHAAGTIITPEPVINYCPLCYDSEDNIMIQLEMHSAMDDLGLTKMDYLGLETVDIIDDTLKMAGLTWEDVNIDHLDLADSKVYNEVYKKGYTVGIFQMESAEARKMCVEAEVDNVEDIIVINAANRPGTKDSFPDYCKNKKYPNDVQVLHEDLKKIFNKTQYVLLYQEQALQLFRYAGFPEKEVDNARRCLDENTLVLMGNGNRKKIKDIKIGDYVMSINKYNVTEPKKVLNVFNNGIKKTFKIKTQHDNYIIGTSEHKVLTQNGWKMIKELNINDWIMTPKKINSLKDNIHPRYKPSEQIMFLLGLLIGDGSLGDLHSIHFTNSEEILIDKYKECVSQLSRSKKNCQFKLSIQNGVEVKYIYHVYIESEEYKSQLQKLLLKYDLNCLAGDKKIPSEFMLYPTGGKLTHLLAGLFNTDGGYNLKNNTIEYYSKSKTLTYQIKSLLMKYDIYSYVESKKVKGYDYKSYTLMIRQKDSLIKFGEKILPFIVGRKKQDYIHIINEANSNKNKYNYMLPEEYYEEIINSAVNYGLSFNDIGNQIGGYKHNGFKLNKNVDITDTKAKNIIQYTYCPNTYQLLMSEYLPLKIIDIKEYEYRSVFDIEVEENHNYIANELIVHNCIGKKLKSEMKKLEVEFTDGLSKKQWNEQQIEEMWQLMLKQAEYSFNRGHAVAYGLLSYLTAYLKTHYPLYFMTACLTAKSDNVSKLSIFINESQRLEIKISPPHINYSGLEFTARIEKNEILFGLLAIKGIGESVVNTILINRPYQDFNNFLEKTKKSGKIDKKTIISLSKAGAFPTKNKKNFLIKYAQSLFEQKNYKPVQSLPKLSDLKEKWGIDPKIIKDKEQRLNLYNEKKQQIFYEEMQKKFIKHMDDFFQKYLQNEYMWEFETLSMFLTHNPLEKAYKYITPWDEIKNGNKAVVLCVIVDIKRKKDKNGNAFAYLDLYTPFGIIESTCWSSQYKNYNDLIKKGNSLAILGRKREGQFFVEEIKSYEKWLIDKKIGK